MSYIITVLITIIVMFLLLAILNYFNFIDLEFPNARDREFDELTDEFEGTDIYGEIHHKDHERNKKIYCKEKQKKDTNKNEQSKTNNKKSK